MGVVLVDMTLSLRQGDSKRGAVWPAFSPRSMLSSCYCSWDALHLRRCMFLCAYLSALSILLTIVSVFVLRLTFMLLLAAVAPKTKTKFQGKAFQGEHAKQILNKMSDSIPQNVKKKVLVRECMCGFAFCTGKQQQHTELPLKMML